MRYIQSITILFCLIFTHAILADEVFFKNNDHISGNFIELSPTSYVFATSHQATLQIKHEQIYRLLITNPVIVELNSGESLIGIAIIEQKLLLNSETLGYLIINLTDIKTIVKSNSKIALINDKLLTITSIKKKLPVIAKNTILTKNKLSIITKKESSTIQGKAAKNKTPETIGEKENNSAQIFLRSKEALLLGKGEKELDISLSYAHNLDLANNFREREIVFPLGFHIGLTDRLEGMIDIPLIWMEQEESVNEKFIQDNAFGLGDITTGFNYQLFTENRSWPDIIGSVNVVIPTGDEPDITDFNSQLALGSGFWRITTGLTLVKAFDPAALFGGISYTHSFANTFNDGIKMQPGDSFSYRFGMGFAINYQLGWFSQFLSIYQADTKYNNIKKLGSAQEPMLLETGITYTIRKDNYIQPTLTFGLNDDATDVAVDISYVRKF